MSDPIPNNTRQTDTQEAQRLEQYGQPSSSAMADAPNAVLISDIGAQLSLGIEQASKKRVNSTPKTKARIADSLVNVAIAAMLENPSMDMKDMWPVLEQLVPGASGDTFKRKLREKLRELNNPEINRILKPRNCKRKVRTKDTGQKISAPVKGPETILREELRPNPETVSTPAVDPKNDHEDDILNGLLLDLGNDKPVDI